MMHQNEVILAVSTISAISKDVSGHSLSATDWITILTFVVALLTNDKEVLNNAFPYLCFSVDFTADNNSNYKNITVNFNKYQIELLSKFQKARVFLALTNTDVDPCINSCSASFDECSIK